MHALVMLFPTLLVIGSAPDCIKFQKEWTVGDMPVFEGDPLVRIARDRLRVAEHMLRRASKAAGPVSERLRETPVSEIIAHVEGTLGALHWLRGRELFREAQYGEAEPEFHKVLELAPNNTVLSLLCICIIQRGGDISDYLENGDGGGDKRLEVLALPFDAAESVAATMDDNEDRAWAWYLLAERAIALREWDLAGRYAERVDELADYLVLEDIRSMWEKIEGKRRPQDAM
jgi:tetratricopeptide (TPR) repeat protein